MSANTGRIKSLLPVAIRDQVFGVIDDKSVNNELCYYAHIDVAHITMLESQGIVSYGVADKILTCIGKLLNSNFAQIKGREAPRGTYLAYEHAISQQLGDDIGGVLQTGRSRNDLRATILRMRLRKTYLELVDRQIALIDILRLQIDKHQSTLFPAFTQYQAAFPITLAQYFSAISDQLMRDVESFLAAFDTLDICPLGAGAGGGTSFAIDCEYTARLLGFTTAVSNSIDAVGSSDIAIKAVMSGSLIATTISRIAADLTLWSSSNNKLIDFPDHLVGSSSNMPQKRNPFLLEEIKGRSASINASLQAILTSNHWTPFGNYISSGSQSESQLWPACRDLDVLINLICHLLPEIIVNRESAEQVLNRCYTDSTFISEQLVSQKGIAFRQAHYEVGEMVTESIESGQSLRQLACEAYALDIDPNQEASDWFSTVVNQVRYGGAEVNVDEVSERLLVWRRGVKKVIDEKALRWSSADNERLVILDKHA